MHDLTLMDFSLGGLGWLLGNQLMWNNLVLLGGELHQLRGNLHYGPRRTEESTIFSSWLTLPPPPTPTPHFYNVPTAQSQKQISHLLPDYGFPTHSCYVWGKSCQPFDCWRHVFAQFNVSVPLAPLSRSRRKDKNRLLVRHDNTNRLIISWDCAGQKQSHSTQLDLLQTYCKCFQSAVWLKRWVLFKGAHQKPWTPRSVYSNFLSRTHR